MQPSPSDSGWLCAAVARLRVHWIEKMLGTTLGMTCFFVVYFWLLHHPRFPLTVMPLTAVDRWLDFRPGALPLYLSLWLYVSLAPALLSDRRELVSYAAAAIVLSTIGLGVFFFWPTTVPPFPVAWLHYPAFHFLKAADAAGNACPSLHVAFAVFSAFWFERILRELGAGPTPRALSWLWCGGILYSTIAVRQHVFLDVLAGSALGAAVALGHFRWLHLDGRKRRG